MMFLKNMAASAAIAAVLLPTLASAAEAKNDSRKGFILPPVITEIFEPAPEPEPVVVLPPPIELGPIEPVEGSESGEHSGIPANVFWHGGEIFVRLDQLAPASPIGQRAMRAVEDLCFGRVKPFELRLTRYDPIVVYQVTINQKGKLEIGGKLVDGYECPEPAGMDGFNAIWEQRAGEYPGTGEFTADHKPVVLKGLTECTDRVYLTPQRLKGFHGADVAMITKTLEANYGQFWVCAVEIGSITYVKLLMEELANCVQLCAMPRLVLWHAHERLVTKYAPRVYTPKPPVQTGGCVNITFRTRDGRQDVTIHAGNASGPLLYRISGGAGWRTITHNPKTGKRFDRGYEGKVKTVCVPFKVLMQQICIVTRLPGGGRSTEVVRTNTLATWRANSTVARYIPLTTPG